MAGKLVIGKPTLAAETEFLLPVSSLVFLERDFVDFLFILPSEDLAGSSDEPPPVVFILFSYFITFIYLTVGAAELY